MRSYLVLPPAASGSGTMSRSSRLRTGKFTSVGFFSRKKLFFVKRLKWRVRQRGRRVTRMRRRPARMSSVTVSPSNLRITLKMGTWGAGEAVERRRSRVNGVSVKLARRAEGGHLGARGGDLGERRRSPGEEEKSGVKGIRQILYHAEDGLPAHQGAGREGEGLGRGKSKEGVDARGNRVEGARKGWMREETGLKEQGRDGCERKQG
eukprot:364753-Chlamydomonas_euryale.AAC.12